MEVTRTFDIIELNLKQYPRDDMYGGRNDGGWYTYSTEDVANHVNWVSYGLMSMGYKQGDKIATISPNKPEWNFVDMGLAQAGMIHVPVYPTIGTDEYAYILDHAEVKAIIIGNKSIYNKVKPIADNLKNLKDIFSFEPVEGVRDFSEIIEAGKSNADKYADELKRIKDSIRPEDMVTIIYTSGTTGNSKGVMLSHNNLISNVKATVGAHHMGYGHKAVSFLPLCHVYERMMNYHFQYKGISIYYIDNMGIIAECIREVKPNLFTTVPRLLEKIYDNIITKGKSLPLIKRLIFFWAVNLGLKYKLKGKSAFYKFKLSIARKLVFSKWREALGNNVEAIVSGGAALQNRLERIFWAAGLPVLQGYGLTETSPVIAVNPLRLDDIKFETVGPVVENVEVKIADDGEILCKGPNVMLGYYKAPELTAEVIDSEGFFHTGDIGVIEDGRFLRITDRKKEMFKLSAGKYIAPQPIENKLKESMFIEQAMVIGENEKFASAIISPNFTYLHDWCSEHKIHFRDNKELIEIPEVIDRIAKEVNHVNKSLGEHEQIKRFRLVTDEWSPQTGELSPTLKLRRNIIAEKYKDIIADIYMRSDKEQGVINRIKNGISSILKGLPKF
ncbi:MAG TPA: long-chain fatty acid--CoA ligase [Bacteroidales bacterium]|nr:long-chain fatty acid--CoA ligase [Bacteroidales bacterium]HQK70678.1 long-chain fatty acid--CoA ligase [Bacteroidales bacterium]